MKDLTQVNDDLENWRNYYRDKKSQRVTFSLEGRYRPQRSDFDYEESELDPPPAPPSKPVNAALAVKYEKAICQLPFKNEFCLVVEYMYKWALNERYFTKTRKIGGISGKNDWEFQVNKAKLMLINRMK